MSPSLPIFIGFLPKKIALRPDWLKSDAVREICSLSNCISKSPPDAISRWKHNGFGLYNTEMLAREVIPDNEESDYEIFAYRLWPAAFDEDGQHDYNPQADAADLGDEPDLSDWERIGYDLIGRSSSSFFECSPLSCNNAAQDHPVNQFCLIDDLDDALEVGKEFGDPASHVEPAMYYLVEVWRKRF